MVIDFHSHTYWSDGVLSPVEHARRALVNGYSAIGMTDHTGVGNVDHLIEELKRDRDIVERYWPIKVIVGVELTHVPAQGIAEAAKAAREAGAEIVVLHGETPVEPVEPGSDGAAIDCGYVDLIGHPGHITEEEVRRAIANDVYLEISARSGHCLTNGHVARLGQALGAKLVVDSDAHSPSDLLTDKFQRSVALGAGIEESNLESVLRTWPAELLQRCLSRREG
ncbi:MAG: histidinol phosphate phosphatase domain-containing protein [Sphaerobacteraceae bacterium]|nr:MAG: histidinol phosphate phosphatase domain-containing protein [Sphaerobacteraceae bacterium]